MPQMAPMNWLILYIFFIVIFMNSIILNYFSFTYMKSSEKKSKYIFLLNWKW
uniref:ATP synthase complex subunit 8 n=1 Tax=Sitophilus zeamais TaxID=7047 RepID=A0A1B1UUK9_SITZE|nr:ATP synthase F0 subunit 8 [Sitophilus zeamais]ANW06510.1 ATP synthase F0 subunit 8 [Sitophilus zeamais]AOS50527.1 ATP synthase F0 subunit 8 [Sitophilus zeamais]QJA14876.1 ATP synthase F0 subunit 8 [Sitophilus zeamais]QKE47554.1 ATP synthase F0 subunit 8 [Sitophilus zeamais]